MRRFSVYKRSNSPYYYAQIKNPKTGKYLPPKSTGCTDEDEALIVVADWLKYGMPQNGRRRAFEDLFMLSTLLSYIESTTITEKEAVRIISALKDKGFVESAIMVSEGPENKPVIPFLTEFWDFDKSEYVRDKLAYGQKIGRRHCYEQTTRISHWAEFFDNAKIREINRSILKEFQFFLNDKGLAPKTINHIVGVGLTAFKWMYTEDKLKVDPGHGLKKFSGESEARGILETDEAKKLFTLDWKDERARVGNLLACTTGLRAAEILAVRLSEIEDNILHVRHSYSRIEELKDTKNHEEGTVPLIPVVKDELLLLADQSPHGRDGYIFYSDSPERPMSQNILRRGLEDTLMKLRAGNKPTDKQRDEAFAYWDKRNIVFHSWRHYYATYIADRVDPRTAQFAMRHKTAAMTKHYANHENKERMKELAEAVGDAFSNIISYKEA